MRRPFMTRLVRLYLSREFLTFFVFGGLAALVNLVVGAAIYGEHFGLSAPYWLAVLIGSTSGLVVNFLLNYLLNFQFRGRSMFEQFRTFCVVAIIGALLTSLCASLLREILTLLRIARVTLPLMPSVSAEFASHVGAIGVVTFYSFAAHRYFSFNVGVRSRLRLMLDSWARHR